MRIGRGLGRGPRKPHLVVRENLICHLSAPARLPAHLFDPHRIRAQAAPDALDHVNYGYVVSDGEFEAHASHVHHGLVRSDQLRCERIVVVQAAKDGPRDQVSASACGWPILDPKRVKPDNCESLEAGPLLLRRSPPVASRRSLTGTGRVPATAFSL